MSFKAIFKQKPEIIQSAHARVNLIGEHTDYTGGFVLPTLLKFKTTIEISANGEKIYQVYSKYFKEKKSSMTLLNLKIMIGLIMLKVVYLFFIMNVNMSRVSI